eukprot:GHVU01233328.1.p1 GENE.GHVU01233328.1~~GHVU01233328.1.p1  ORF type:complete len:190 (-),score=70.35 GHVU01233328.1:115-651(-)
MRSPERVFEEFDRNVMEVGELERSNEERTNQLQVLEEAGAWLCECEKITEGIYQTIAAEEAERELLRETTAAAEAEEANAAELKTLPERLRRAREEQKELEQLEATCVDLEKQLASARAEEAAVIAMAETQEEYLAAVAERLCRRVQNDRVHLQTGMQRIVARGGGGGEDGGDGDRMS